MDIEKYIIFLKVLELQSFSKAAAKLGYTQSAISHSIYSLENYFGFKLLNREPGHITLTPSGKEVFSYIYGVVKAQELLNQAASSFTKIEKGTLYIASIPSLAIHWFPEMLKCFRQRYPEIHITLIHGNYSEVEKHITSGTVDCGFLSVSPKTAVTYKVLFREKLYVILPPQHELAKKDRLFLKDLEGYEFIMPGEGPNHQVGDLIQKNDLHLNIKYAISDDDITVALISQGLGITILPELSYKDYLNFKIVSRELSENPFREIGIAYTSWDNISPIGKVFIKFVKNYFLGKNQADENAKNIGSR